MPPIPPVTKNFMLACVVALCLGLLLPVARWFALWPIGSGLFWPWQLVSYAFLHADLGHLLFNMLGLWMFGAELERLWGPRRYQHFLLVSALSAGVAQLLVAPLLGAFAPTVGASGILFGLLMAYALSFPHRQFDLVGFLPMVLMMLPGQIFQLLGMVLFFVLMTNRQAVPIPPLPLKSMAMVALYGGLELLQGLFLRGSVAHFAHLGGMLGGWLIIRYWRGQSPFPRRRR